MNQEVTSILVLAAIFAIGTLRPINMGCSASPRRSWWAARSA
jgi:hypothetical protein